MLSSAVGGGTEATDHRLTFEWGDAVWCSNLVIFSSPTVCRIPDRRNNGRKSQIWGNLSPCGWKKRHMPTCARVALVVKFDFVSRWVCVELKRCTSRTEGWCNKTRGVEAANPAEGCGKLCQKLKPLTPTFFPFVILRASTPPPLVWSRRHWYKWA